MGLSEELAQQSLTPLVISTFVCLVSEYKLYFQKFLRDFFLLFKPLGTILDPVQIDQYQAL